MIGKCSAEDDGYLCTSTSPSLLEEAKIRAPGAWERLVDLYAPMIYRWCRRTGVEADDAPDVLQEVFLAVATHIGDFHRDRAGDSFRGWLWTITQNKIHDHFRQQKKQLKAPGGSSAYERLCRIPERPPLILTPDQPSADEASLVQRVVELIRPETEDHAWQAFWLLTMGGRSGPDVAVELGMSVRAVYQAKYRVLQRVRQELDGLTKAFPGLGFGKQCNPSHERAELP